jgi:hypothetical protein
MKSEMFAAMEPQLGKMASAFGRARVVRVEPLERKGFESHYSLQPLSPVLGCPK